MSGIGGLLQSKKGSLALVGAGLLFLADSGFMDKPPSDVIVYCGSALFGVAILSQAVIDAIAEWKRK